MANIENPIATDSAVELREVIGDDATATFEADPKFIDSNPTSEASSENVEVQREADDVEDSDEEEDELDEEDEVDDGEEDELDEEDDDEDDEEEDDDEDDVDEGVDEDDIDEDDMDTDEIAEPALRERVLVA